MAKFRFQLEKVLRHKKILEEQAKRDFSEIKAKLDQQRNFLNDLESDLKKSYNDKYLVTKMGGEIAEYLGYFNEFNTAQKKLIDQQKRIVDGLEKIVEEKRLRLVEAAREHKTFIKLKEKKKEEFKKEINKKEQKRIDEMNILRFDFKEKI